LNAAAPVRAVAAWPAALNDPQAALAGCQYSTFALTWADPMTMKCTFTCSDESSASSLADKAIGLVAQIRQLFPLLANQQNLDPAMSKFITATANAAKVARTGGSVTISAELTAEMLK
jgi:hypothetical protein